MTKRKKINFLPADYENFIDSDHDGLTDREEKMLGTNPYDADTDGDGVDDGLEVKLGRNPLLADNLKDFFIPHQGNDYKPQALLPKRLLFYAFTSVVMKAVIFLAVAVIPIQAWLTPDVLTEQSQKIIQLTNEIRKNLNISLLTQNSLLNQAALAKAQDMILNQYFDHVSQQGKGLAFWLNNVNYNYKSAGENLALGFADAKEVVDAWVKSSTHYKNIIDSDFSQIGVAMVSGTFADADTSLVAQFFGQPDIKLAPAASSPITAKPSVTAKLPSATTKTSPTVKTSPVKQETLGQVVTKPATLAVPILISPVDNSLTNKNTINLTITATSAEELVVYLDNQELKTLVNSLNGNFDTQISLKEGAHQLTFKAIKGEQSQLSKTYYLTVDNTAPTIDQEKTYLSLSEFNDNGDKIINTIAYLSPDTDSAKVIFNNYTIQLTRDQTNLNKWAGKTVIFKQGEEQAFNPVLLPNLTAIDKAGNIATTDIKWQAVASTKPSLLNQYFFLKSSGSKYFQPLFDLTSIYYKIILIIAIIALLLNILVQIRKQHPHIIASGLGLIMLLIFLIII